MTSPMNQPLTNHDPISSPQEEYDSLRSATPEFPCPYLPGRKARYEAYLIDVLGGEQYERLLSLGFRRNGSIVYRPSCRQCGECKQLRVPVNTFSPTRSMRRILKHNADVRVEIESSPEPTWDKFAMFVRYLDAQHDGSMTRSYPSFCEFLYGSPMETVEVQYRIGQTIVGISIIDRCPGGLSSVYMFYDPDQRGRSLGTYSALWEIDYCRRNDLPYYYLGYYVSGCQTMDYKARFRPNEILVGGNCWSPLRG